MSAFIVGETVIAKRRMVFSGPAYGRGPGDEVVEAGSIGRVTMIPYDTNQSGLYYHVIFKGEDIRRICDADDIRHGTVLDQMVLEA